MSICPECGAAFDPRHHGGGILCAECQRVTNLARKLRQAEAEQRIRRRHHGHREH